MGNKMGIKTVDLKDTLFERDCLDKAYEAFITNKTDVDYRQFDKWLWENYKMTWETGAWYTDNILQFHDEKMMSMFFLRYS